MNGGGLSAGQVAAPQHLRDEVEDALERLSGLLLRAAVDTAGLAVEKAGNGPNPTRLQETVRFLGQVVSGWPDLPEDALPDEGAGYGSTVVVEDVERGGHDSCTLVTGALVDIDAGQVSLASPIGRALIGTKPGDVVTVQTPQRRRTLRVVSVCTLRHRLRQHG